MLVDRGLNLTHGLVVRHDPTMFEIVERCIDGDLHFYFTIKEGFQPAFGDRRWRTLSLLGIAAELVLEFLADPEGKRRRLRHDHLA